MKRGMAEKIGTSCTMTAIMLAWFLGLDIAGIEPGLSLLGWAVVAPFVLYPLLTRALNSTVRGAEETQGAAMAERNRALLNYLRGQTDTSLRTILDSCDRIKARATSADSDWRLGEEAATIHYEVMRVQDAISRTTQTVVPPSGSPVAGIGGDTAGPGPRQDRRTIEGYVRRSAGLANCSRGA